MPLPLTQFYPWLCLILAAEATKKAKAEGGDATAASDAAQDGKDGKDASRDPSRSPAPASKEDREKEERKEKERPATRRVLSNEQLCLAFRYLDKTGAGYIRCAAGVLCLRHACSGVLCLKLVLEALLSTVGCCPAARCLPAVRGRHVCSASAGSHAAALASGLLKQREQPTSTILCTPLASAGPTTCASCWMPWAWRCTTPWSRSSPSTSRCVRLPCCGLSVVGQLAG